jgi:CheY-like chemotaxis protein
MDHMMPGMDGIEATHNIRARGGKFEAIPIIALSANAVSGVYEQFLEAGMNDFLSKPISGRSLNNILAKWLPYDKITLASPPDTRSPGSASEDGAPAEDELLRSLRTIRGLDVDAGMSYCANNEDIYAKTLLEFCNRFSERAGAITNCLEKRDWENYSIFTHGLKSVLLNVGNDELAEKAKELELASKAITEAAARGEESEPDEKLCLRKTENVLGDMRNFCKRLHKTPLFDRPAPKTLIGAPELAEILSKLRQKCEDYDADAALELTGQLAQVSIGDAEIDDALARIATNVDSVEYDEAVEDISGLLRHLGISQT